MDITPPEPFDTLFTGCRIASMQNGGLGIIENGALGITGGVITWIGKEKDLPGERLSAASDHIKCSGKWILPGFVECHTHLVWAGSRSKEFEMRLSGVSYEQIARQGGGIMSTVQATRNASADELFELSESRVKHFMKQGVTCLEIKSGYGLDTKTELKILEVIGRLKQHLPLHIEGTFLGAHAVPPEYTQNSDQYIDLVCGTMLPQVKSQGIAKAVDMFCENIAFSRSQTRKVFQSATGIGLAVKLHAEQLSDSDGAALAAEYNAISCDHLEYLSPRGARKMAENGTTAVLLPGAYHYLKQTTPPPVELMRRLGISMAVSTDLNPGSSPVHSFSLALNMACIFFGLTCEEALLGGTINAAKALGLEDRKGSLEPGKDADLVLWDIDTPVDLCYLTGTNPVEMVIIQGKVCV